MSGGQRSIGFPFLMVQARSEKLENAFFLAHTKTKHSKQTNKQNPPHICCWDVRKELRERGNSK